MRNGARALGVALIASAGLGSAHVAAAQRPEALWYTTRSQRSTEDFIAHASQISIVAPQVYSFDRNGGIHGKIDPQLVAAAREHHVKVVPLVVNPGFDQDMAHRLFTVASVRARAVKSLVSLCRENKFDGLQFDLENINVRDRDAFTRFARESSAALHHVGCSLSAAVVPRTSDEPGPTAFHRWMFENWRGAYDYKALADTLDFISYMTYAEHTANTTPGPVAGYTWMVEALDFVLSKGVPPSKISLGIPSYSDYWYPGFTKKGGEHATGRDISYATAESLITRYRLQPRWDEADKAEYAFWNNVGVYNHVWIEDARAFQAKAALVKERGLRGYSVWVMGFEDPKVWGVEDGKGGSGERLERAR